MSRVLRGCAAAALLATTPALTVTLATAAEAAPASSVAITVGDTPSATSSVFNCGPFSGIQTASASTLNSYAVPSAGVLTSFAHAAGAGVGSVRLLVFRPTATAGEYTLVAKSDLQTLTASTLNTFPTRISTQPGDLLGLQVSGDTNCAFGGASGDDHSYIVGFNPDTDTSFNTTGAYEVSGNRWNISAQLEPDADGDGYGDISQDQCPTDATTQGACAVVTPPAPPTTTTPDTTAPDTTLVKGPRKQVHKRSTVFRFKSSDTIQSFQCSLDGSSFTACQAPVKKKFKPGKHTFAVRAVDQAGNVDATPATVKWKFVPQK